MNNSPALSLESVIRTTVLSAGPVISNALDSAIDSKRFIDVTPGTHETEQIQISTTSDRDSIAQVEFEEYHNRQLTTQSNTQYAVEIAKFLDKVNTTAEYVTRDMSYKTVRDINEDPTKLAQLKDELLGDMNVHLVNALYGEATDDEGTSESVQDKLSTVDEEIHGLDFQFFLEPTEPEKIAGGVREILTDEGAAWEWLWFGNKTMTEPDITPWTFTMSKDTRYNINVYKDGVLTKTHMKDFDRITGQSLDGEWSPDITGKEYEVALVKWWVEESNIILSEEDLELYNEIRKKSLTVENSGWLCNPIHTLNPTTMNPPTFTSLGMQVVPFIPITVSPEQIEYRKELYALKLEDMDWSLYKKEYDMTKATVSLYRNMFTWYDNCDYKVTLQVKTNTNTPRESYTVTVYYTNRHLIDKAKHIRNKDIEVLDLAMPEEVQKVIPRHGKKFMPDIGTKLYTGEIMKECKVG